MPFLFEPIADYTELLMPDDLLSENSILQGVREALTPETCQDVEVIGWLYQFYISERKDEVFENLKKNIKIEARDIPAATQLFTPNWIVKYMVQNSLGAQWLATYPDSPLKGQMAYYIEPAEQTEEVGAALAAKGAVWPAFTPRPSPVRPRRLVCYRRSRCSDSRNCSRNHSRSRSHRRAARPW